MPNVASAAMPAGEPIDRAAQPPHFPPAERGNTGAPPTERHEQTRRHTRAADARFSRVRSSANSTHPAIARRCGETRGAPPRIDAERGAADGIAIT